MTRASAAAGGSEDRATSQRWASVASRTRLATMLLAGFAAAIATGLSGAWGYAPLAAWDSAAMVFTVWVWLAIGPMCSSATASHATREDPGHVLTDRIVLIASVASLGAVGFVLVQAGSANGGPAGSARRP